MADPGQDSPMPDRSTVDFEPIASEDLAEDVMPGARTNSVDSSAARSHLNSRHGSPERHNSSANAPRSSNSSSWSSDHSSSPNDSSKESGPPDTTGWFPISEDLSTAPPAEIAHIEALGEHSALDKTHWTSKFPELNDPEYIVGEQGNIEWVISPFNGTLQSPKKEFVYTSKPVRIGGFSWRLKVFPKGLEGPYLAVNLECKVSSGFTGFLCDDSTLLSTSTRAGAQPTDLTKLTALQKAEERRDSATAISEPTSEKGNEVQATVEVNKSSGAWRVPAQFEIVIYNPQEPRVHFHKGSSQSFSEKSPSCSFKRMAPINITDIGMRLSGQRQALLRNDTLGVVAYIRTFHDETGCLFLRNAENWNSLAISGFRGIQGSRQRLQHNQCLLAAVTTWLFMPPVQRIFTSVKSLQAADTTLPNTPLAMALARMSSHLKSSDTSLECNAELEDIEGALAWHGAILDEGAEVFEAWELLKSVLYNELKSLSSSALMDDYSRLGSCRFAPPYDHTRTIREVQSLMLDWDMDKAVSNGLPIADNTSAPIQTPRLLHIQLPRQRFDSDKRKWKKSRRPYDLNESLDLASPYRLQAIILHEESDLKSRTFSTIVRADGKNFFKYGPDYQRVVRLTKQQALVDTKASAYAAIYVLEEALNQEPPYQPANSTLSAKSIEQATKSPVPLELTFVNSSSFDNSTHPGILDQYQLPSDFVHKMTLDTPEAFPNVEDHLERLFLKGQNDKKLYVWELDQSLSRFHPDFMAADLCSEGLAAREGEPGVFWIRIGNCNEFQPVKASEPEISTEGSGGQEHANNPTAKPPPQANQQQASSSTIETGQNTNSSGDTTMLDVDEVKGISKVETPDPDALSETYVFVKYFDIESQTLRGVCSYIADRSHQIQSSVREHAASLFNKDREYRFFEEHDPNCENACGITLVPLGKSAVFKCEISEFSSTIVVEPVLSQGDKDKILLAGGIVDLSRFLSFVFMDYIDPSKVAKSDQVLKRNYFGSAYHEGTFSRGQPHGQGKEITLGGEEYEGDFKMGLRNGKGFLRLQNNNTYEGDFWDGRPHGTGKHIEAFTGNTYTGGFQRGKKRGRGTTEWQQAEEEAKVCRICYDNEQDCAFYPCGHVCACLECAKMASNCPMCHREGSRPFKLYFAS